MYGATILVLIPHPDDEVVGACTAIARARAGGSKVLGAYLTDGIAARRQLWPWLRRRRSRRVARRRAEARAAAELLGVLPVLEQSIASRSLRHALAHTHAALRDLVRAHRVDTIWTPAYEGGHQDHDVANFLASRLHGQAAVWEFSEYHYAGRSVNCNRFIAIGGEERMLTLNEAERSRKRQALALYRSERGNLSYVRTERECFRPLVGYDYARAPHGGRTFYQRFQWVPRHPRIDYTTPDEVCLAINRFEALPDLPARPVRHQA